MWIIGPNVSHKVCAPKNVKLLKWEDYVCKKDVVKTLGYLIQICFSYLKLAQIAFPIYRYWDFCLVALSLERISPNTNLYFSNQMDRWALLFDRLPSKSKTLLQHGIDLDYEGKLVRLNNIDHFYAISKGSWQNSYKYLLDCQPKLHLLKSTIELSEVESDRVTVLIISHIIYIEIETKILETLCDLPIKIYLKKHPTVIKDVPYKEMQEKYGFTYITDSTFPKVDYVISYESTLAYEYMNYDIPLFTYNPEKEVDFDTMKREVTKLIEGNNKSINS